MLPPGAGKGAVTDSHRLGSLREMFLYFEPRKYLSAAVPKPV